MAQRILYQNGEGGLSIIVPVTDELTVEQIAQKDVPQGRACIVVDDSVIPIDRHFRNAWEIKENNIAVNMTKALEIQKDIIREERQPLLDALDVEYMKALEAGNASLQAEIAAKKQTLRDSTASELLALATTPDELKAVTVTKIMETAGYAEISTGLSGKIL